MIFEYYSIVETLGEHVDDFILIFIIYLYNN